MSQQNIDHDRELDLAQRRYDRVLKERDAALAEVDVLRERVAHLMHVNENANRQLLSARECAESYRETCRTLAQATLPWEEHGPSGA